MAESEETKAAVEYWDRVAAIATQRTAEETVERNRDRAAEREARKRAAELSRVR